MISIYGNTENDTDFKKVLPEGYRLEVYEELDSTNAEAMRKAAAGAEDHLWIRAGIQSHGRGRSGRGWVSSGGNLFASLFLKLDCDINVIAQLSLLAGVAAYDALTQLCDRETGAGIRLKWPNDLLLEDAKTGGILLESSRLSSTGPVAVVIGTGINLQNNPELGDRHTANLAVKGCIIDPEDALFALAQSTDRWLTIWNQGRNFEQIREAWILRGQKAGTPVRVNSGSTVVEGYFAGLNEVGGMILQSGSGEYEHIHFGDVMLVGETKKKV